MKVTNRDLFDGKNALQQLVMIKLPVIQSANAAKLFRLFNDALKDLDIVRRSLIETYGTDAKSGRGKEVLEFIDIDGEEKANPAFDSFKKEWNELLDMEVDVKPVKVLLPQMVSSVCDKCHHNMDKPLEIEPWIIATLDKFVEVQQ